MDKKEDEKDGEDKSQPRSIRDRRRPREKRRSTGVSFWTQDVKTHPSRWPPARRQASTNRVFRIFQGDENDPDQQSDLEESSLKGELQVKTTPLILTLLSNAEVLLLPLFSRFPVIVAAATLNLSKNAKQRKSKF